MDTHGVVTPYEGTDARHWDPAVPVPAPLTLHRTPVRPEWVDYNGHMSESCYLLIIGDNSDAFFRYFGIDEHYRAAGHSLYTVETHLHYRGEAVEGDPLTLTVQLIDFDTKRLHLFHTMRHGTTGRVLLTAEQLLVHVDMNGDMDKPRAVPLPAHLTERLRTIRAAHAALPVPEDLGHVIGIPRR